MKEMRKRQMDIAKVILFQDNKHRQGIEIYSNVPFLLSLTWFRKGNWGDPIFLESESSAKKWCCFSL